MGETVRYLRCPLCLGAFSREGNSLRCACLLYTSEPSDVLGGQSLYEKYGAEYQDIIDAITAVGEDY